MMKFSFPARLCPPDGYSFTFPDGTRIRATDRGTFYSKIADHYRWNDIPMPLDWKEQAEDQCCQAMPPGWCKYDTGEDAEGIVNPRMEMGDLFRGMEVLLRIAASPDPLVDQKEADRRAAICSGCFANMPVEGCMPCMKIPDMVASIAGAKTTQYDYLLRTCGICHCQNSAQAWIKDEILAKGITPDMHRRFQRVPHCWKKDLKPT